MTFRISSIISVLLTTTFVGAQQQIPKSAIDALVIARKPIESLEDRHYSCESTSSSIQLEQGQFIKFSSKTFMKASGQNLLYGTYVTSPLAKRVDTHSFDAVVSKNSHYLFKAERSKLSSSWALVKVARNDEDLPKNESELIKIVETSNKRPFAKLFSLPLKFGDSRAEQLSSLPNYSLDSFAESPDGRKYTIAFRCAGATKGVADSSISTCRVVYDLDQFGIPVEFSETNINGDMTRLLAIKTSFQQIGDKTYSKILHRKETYHKSGTLIYSTESDSKPVYTLGKLPESEFLCSAFGLPEPPGYEPVRTPIYVWVLGVSAALLLLAVLLRYLAKRQS